jgi:methionyl-tRNA synthetase
MLRTYFMVCLKLIWQSVRLVPDFNETDRIKTHQIRQLDIVQDQSDCRSNGSSPHTQYCEAQDMFRVDEEVLSTDERCGSQSSRGDPSRAHRCGGYLSRVQTRPHGTC